MEEMYYMYGDQWYVFQYDIEGYFDNISHKAAKKIMKQIGEEGYAIYEKIVDSFCIRDGYAALEHPENPDGYGYPKGTLPSQWTGIIYWMRLTGRYRIPRAVYLTFPIWMTGWHFSKV